MDKTLFLDELNKLDVAHKNTVELYNEISLIAMKCAGEISETKNHRNAYYFSMCRHL